MKQRRPEKSNPNEAIVLKDPKGYFTLNVVFLCIILMIVLYSLLFREGHPIPAALTNFTGIEPPSKGLSVAFSQIVRLNLGEALALNPHSLRVFSFFFIQLLMRLGLIISIKKNKTLSTNGYLIFSDILISLGLFVFCFYPLIEYTLRIMSQLLH